METEIFQIIGALLLFVAAIGIIDWIKTPKSRRNLLYILSVLTMLVISMWLIIDPAGMIEAFGRS